MIKIAMKEIKQRFDSKVRCSETGTNQPSTFWGGQDEGQKPELEDQGDKR